MNGHTEIVKHLLLDSRVDPSDNNNEGENKALLIIQPLDQLV